MIGHTVLFPALMGTFCTLALTLGLLYLHRVRRLAGVSGVTELLGRLRPVDTSLLLAVRAEQDGTFGSEQAVTPSLFESLDGLRGLEILSENSAVLIDLACYVQRWYPEALPVAEQLRLNAREFEWHLERLRGAAQRGHLRAAYPDYAQRAVMLYFAMTQHVVELYKATQVPGWVELQAIL